MSVCGGGDPAWRQIEQNVLVRARGTPLAAVYSTAEAEIKLPVPRSELGYLEMDAISLKAPQEPAEVEIQGDLGSRTTIWKGEIVRAGILAVNKGQTEASHALGIRPGPTLRLVVIPQAMRVIIPPLASQYLNLTKNSSLAVAIGYPDERKSAHPRESLPYDKVSLNNYGVQYSGRS